jgi:hypothetical protein
MSVVLRGTLQRGEFLVYAIFESAISRTLTRVCTGAASTWVVRARSSLTVQAKSSRRRLVLLWRYTDSSSCVRVLLSQFCAVMWCVFQ